MDLSKVEIVINWNLPTNEAEVRSFVGLVGYYRWFIDEFSKIVTPLALLIQKGVPFIQNYECGESFMESKCRLTSVSVLILPDNTRRFQVYHDASYIGLGCILMQHGRVVTYGS